MKRYWRLIAVILVVVLTIGTFYVQSAITANGLPDITVEKVSGNEDEMKSVTISGSYNLGRRIGDPVQVDSDGSTYSSEQSLFEHFRNRFFNERVNQMQEEYRSFMRGKGGNDASYLETEDTLAYADVINQTVPGRDEMELDIAVLDKASDEEAASFTVPLPNRAKYRQVYVEDVQMTDNELRVITRNYPRDGGEEAAHLYRINIPDGEITGEDRIALVETGENQQTYVNVVSASDRTTAHDTIIFKKMTRSISDDPNREAASEQPAEESVEYIVYKPETEETRSLDLPGALADQEILDRDNTALYFIDEQQIVQYDLETEQISSETEVPSFDKEAEKRGGAIRIWDDKAYMLTRNEQAPERVVVLDLKSGDTLYEGKIKLDKPVDENASLDLYELSIE
ncbi:hypothetical protein [Lentibacillus salinarum]|uniref:HlyD family secretion protein n=1 Tax=Lentibacillus salinarum TaxID=446820 RepID=A0ABW3ZRZ1_9BACI